MVECLKGLVTYPFQMPAKRMVNGVEVEDSDSDGEIERKMNRDKNDAAEKSQEKKKIALIVDTNVLLKQTQLRELLKVPDMQTFEELFEVITLDTVVKEIKDEQSRAYVDSGLPYTLDVKTAKTFIEKQDMI